MSIFDLAIPILLKLEGGFSNDPTDPGGPTNKGLTLRFIRSLGEKYENFTIDDLKNLSDEEISEIYRMGWWDKYNYSRINDQALATKVFGFSVNMGATQSHKLLQRACWAINGYQCIQDDGVLGDVTFALINQINPIQPLRSEAAGFYRSLIAVRPELQTFKKGWLARAYA